MEVITILENEKYLRQKSKKINKNDKDLKQDIKVIEDYCKNNEVLAMASVQLGISKRLIYLKNTNLELVKKCQRKEISDEEERQYNEAKVLINPIIKIKEGLTEYWEACASCLDNMALVKRPYKIEVEYYDEFWNKQKESFEGFAATVLSHEIDHLDGILHMDIAEEILVMPAEERKAFRRQGHDYFIYTKKGKYEDLLKKGIK